jgi:putative SOS response-associated peptidase YedK
VGWLAVAVDLHQDPIGHRPIAFVTTEPAVGAIHPKTMLVILTEAEEIETWMTAPWEQARALQRPLPDGALVEVACG